MATSKMRTENANFDDIPGQLPTCRLPEGVDLDEIANITLEKLNNLQQQDFASIAIWRDILSFTDTFRTFYSAEFVHTTFSKLRERRKCSPFRLAKEEPRIVRLPGSSWIDIGIEFSTYNDELVCDCSGIVSMMPDDNGNWKIWMLRTWLERYDGHSDPDRIPIGQSNGPQVNGQSHTLSNRVHDKTYDAIIVGGGQGGLGLAGRLQALGIDYKLFDNRPKIGDSWAHRYDSLKFHTIKEYSNLPFGRTWNDDDPREIPKDRIASGYREWAQKHGINAVEDTQVDSARWADNTRAWTIRTSRASDPGQVHEYRAKNLILCIGVGHKVPISPEWATAAAIGSSGYKGTIIHATKYRNAKAFAGKHGIVVGTANTAHDVAEDMANESMNVTMCQRSSTFIFPQEWLVASEERDYNVEKATDVADRQQITAPTKITREMVNRSVHDLIDRNPQLFDGLESVGFKVDRYGDLFTNLYIRYGGHYVDIGGSGRIIKGEIKVKTDAITGLTADGLLFEDGSQVKADLIVLATGFNHDFRKDAAEIVGQDVAEQMDHFWKPDGEGEIRGYARLAGHPALYYHGAEARMARFYSRFVALQIQKELLGKLLQPYLEGRPSMQQPNGNME